MADKKISELAAITGSATAADDYFILVDTSGAATKKISRAELNNAIEADVLSTVNIDGGTIDGTVIGGSVKAAGSFTSLITTSNVGVGTASPITLIEATGDTPEITITSSNPLDTSSGTEDISSVGFRGQKNNLYRVIAKIQATQQGTWSTVTAANAPSALEFYTQSGGSPDAMAAPRMLIDNDGNVAIATTAATEKLEVGGNVILDVDNAHINIKSGVTGTSGAVNWTFNTDDTAYASMSLAYDTRASLGLVADTGYPISLQSNGSGGFIRFQTHTAERMRLTNTGLGIGLTAPVYPLQVVGEAASSTFVSYAAGQYGGLHFKNSSNVREAIIDYDHTAGILGIKAHTAGHYITFMTGGYSERMRIAADGKVGIGMTPVASYGLLQVGSAVTSAVGVGGLQAFISGTNSALGQNGNLSIVTTDGQAANIGGSIGFGGKFVASGLSGVFASISGRKENGTDNNGAGYLQFATEPNGGTPTEKMRISSAGRVLIGQTASTNNAGKLEVTATGTNAADFTVLDSSYALVCSNNGSAGGLVYFNYNTSNVGTITTNGSNTTYATSSDYRLKEDAQPVEAPINRLKQLKPINFKWKVNGSRCDGFLAHEAQEIVPDAVTGSKDDLDKEGKPIYQGIDQSKLVPLLTAALQEAVAKIEALETRLTALEG